MSRYLFILFVFCFPFTSKGQDFIDKSREKVKEKLEQYLRDNGLHSVLTINDSLISLRIEDSSVKPTLFIFHFIDEKCVEEIKVSCDTCVISYMNGILVNRSMQWKKMNDTTWLSRFSKRRMLVLELNGTMSALRIRKTNWDKKTYKGVIATLDQTP